MRSNSASIWITSWVSDLICEWASSVETDKLAIFKGLLLCGDCSWFEASPTEDSLVLEAEDESDSTDKSRSTGDGRSKDEWESADESDSADDWDSTDVLCPELDSMDEWESTEESDTLELELELDTLLSADWSRMDEF